MRSADIVLVEDNPDDVAVALRALRRGGVDRAVHVLRDGRAALEWVHEVADGRRPAPRVVFLDLRLPREDGRTVLKALRASEATRRVPVVVVSSSRLDREIEECYRLGANSFITKKYGEAPPGQYIVRAADYWLSLNRLPHHGDR